MFLPFTGWDTAFADNRTLTAAVLDLLLHHAHILQITELPAQGHTQGWSDGQEDRGDAMGRGAMIRRYEFRPPRTVITSTYTRGLRSTSASAR